MFYRPDEGHDLPHDPFKALVSPRPIGWISSQDDQGRVNLAPYSFFNAICSDPPLIMFSSEGDKDTLKNVRLHGEFVCNIVSYDFADLMNQTSATFAYGVSEPEQVGIALEVSQNVAPPRVKGIAAALECRVVSIQQLYDSAQKPLKNWMIIGQVIGIYIADHVLKDGRVDMNTLNLIARCGYHDYALADHFFTMKRPTL
jgi:flavin reductase (DIM6/NTAB) family NADH-FMN oxidoreductase RutF